MTLAIWRAGARARERRAQGHAGRVCKFTDHNVRRTPPCSRAPSRPPTQRQQELCLLFGLGWDRWGVQTQMGGGSRLHAQLGRLTSSSFRSSLLSRLPAAKKNSVCSLAYRVGEVAGACKRKWCAPGAQGQGRGSAEAQRRGTLGEGVDLLIDLLTTMSQWATKKSPAIECRPYFPPALER